MQHPPPWLEGHDEYPTGQLATCPAQLAPASQHPTIPSPVSGIMLQVNSFWQHEFGCPMELQLVVPLGQIKSRVKSQAMPGINDRPRSGLCLETSSAWMRSGGRGHCGVEAFADSLSSSGFCVAVLSSCLLTRSSDLSRSNSQYSKKNICPSSAGIFFTPQGLCSASRFWISTFRRTSDSTLIGSSCG